MSENMEKALRVLTERILTPILYTIEYDYKINFICFCDKNIKLSDLYEAENELTDILGIPAEIIDIREFSEPDRMEVLKRATLVYSADPEMEKIFISSVAEDYAKCLMEKMSMIARYRHTGSGYLQ